MDEKNKKDQSIQESVNKTEDLGKKIFRIVDVLDNDPTIVCGALAVALGMACGLSNFPPSDLMAVMDAYFKRTQEFVASDLMERLKEKLENTPEKEEVLPKKDVGLN